MAASPRDNPLPLYLLCGLYPAVFLASKNWYLFTGRQLALLVLLTPAVSLLLGLVLRRLSAAAAHAGRRVLRRGGGGAEQRIRNLLDALFSGAIFLFLMRSVIFYRYDETWFKIAIVAFGAACLALVVSRAGLRLLNVSLAIMVLFASFEWTRSHRRFVNEVRDASWSTAERERVERLVLARRPNVYLIQLESYQSREAYRAVYGFDNREFEAALETLGFTVLPDQFSNYSYTLAGLAALFGMNHHYYRIAIGNDDALGVRDMIGGKAYNPVLRAFLKNGYRAQLVHPTDYAFIAGDGWEYVHPSRKLAHVLAIYRSAALDRLVERAYRALSAGDDFDAILEERLRAAARSTRPVFTYLAPPGLDHSPVDRTWSELGAWARGYPAQVRAASAGFLALAQRIVAGDPGAVVILAGDHGATRYRGIWRSREGLAHELRKEGVPARTLALDLFGTFLAVRDPGGDPRRFAGATPVNLFRVLFGELAGNDAALGPRAAPDSYQFVNREPYRSSTRELNLVVRAGQPLEAWEELDPPAPATGQAR